MMSVIVKGMEMLKDCYDCPLHDGETGRCNILGITICDYIPKECPLVEVVRCKDGGQAMPTERMERSERKLKPCPFCGGKARFVQTAYGREERASCRFQFAIRCVKCDATAPNAYGSIYVNLGENGTLNLWRDDRSKAIEAWNRRAEE